MSLLPIRCPACGAVGAAPCLSCARLVAPAPPVPPIPGLTKVVAGFSYSGTGAALLRSFKYRHQRSLASWFAECLATALTRPSRSTALGETLSGAELVSWIPASRRGRARRGFDQSEQVARLVARRLGVRCLGLFERRSNRPQTGQTRSDRLVGPTLVLRRGGRSALAGTGGPRVLIIDDVLTTGASVRSAAECLHAHAMLDVHAAVVAFNPGRRCCTVDP